VLFLWSGADQFLGTVTVLSVACVALTAAALANFAIVYALTAGRVSAVRGTVDQAELLNNEGTVVLCSKIRFVSNLDRNDARKSADRQDVVFLAGLRPSSCSASTFQV
jgi:hypothetical protein